MAHPHKDKDHDLFADPAEANGTGQLLIRNGTENAGEVVDDHKGQKCVQQSVTPSQEPAKPAANGGEGELDVIPKFFHEIPPTSIKMAPLRERSRLCEFCYLIQQSIDLLAGILAGVVTTGKALCKSNLKHLVELFLGHSAFLLSQATMIRPLESMMNCFVLSMKAPKEDSFGLL